MFEKHNPANTAMLTRTRELTHARKFSYYTPVHEKQFSSQTHTMKLQHTQSFANVNSLANVFISAHTF